MLERTSFVGRETDLAALADLLAGGAALVTLVGPGGIGKTRLARRFALGLGDDGRHVSSCDLADAKTRDDVLGALAGALGVPLDAVSRDGAEARIGHAVAAMGDALVVLDDVERCAAAVAPMLSAWIGAAPRARWIVTSRARLRIEEETCLEVGPLADDDAVSLFEDRARRGRRRPAASGEIEVVRELVRRLDHNPLAIELAAARADVLPPRAFLERLSARLDLLRATRTARAPGTAGRHATMRAVLDGSFDLLAPWERSTLAQCSVFRGGFTLEAAQAVVSLDGAPADVSAMDAVEALVDHSLVLRRETDGETRFALLETVAEYAAEKLVDEDPGAGARARHAAHFLARVDAAIADPTGPSVGLADRSLAADHDNLVAVLRGAAGRDPEAVARVALCLDAMAANRMPAEAHHALLDEALGVSSAASPALRVRLLRARGAVARKRGRLPDARADLEAAIEIAQRIGDGALETLARITLGDVEVDAGEMDAARDAAGAALEMARAAGDRRAAALSLRVLARVCIESGDSAGARAPALEALSIGRALGLRSLECQAENQLGAASILARHLREASDHFSAVLAIATGLEERHSESAAHSNLAKVLGDLGRHADAEEHYERGLALCRRMGYRRSQAIALYNLGVLEHDRARLESARERFDEALAIARELGARPVEGPVLVARGLLDLEQSRFAEAEEQLAAARDLGRELGLAEIEGSALAGLGVAAALRGRFEEAEDALASAVERLSGETEGLEVARVLTAVVDAERSRRATGDRASALRASARDRIAAAAPAAEASALVRIAARIASSLDAPPRPDEGSSRALVVGDDARWFRAGESESIDLSRRRALRLLLLALAGRRAACPGEALSLDALFAAGWPGERVAASAAHRRVYTAIGMLRDLGLRDVLVRRDDGYLLDPSAPLRFPVSGP